MASKLSLKTSEKIELISNLSTMLGASIPILEAVDSIMEDTKGTQRKILETMRRDMMQGKPLYASLSEFPRCFDKVTVNLVRAAEEAGTLEVTLRDLRDHIQKEAEFVDKIIFALIYPALIMCLFFVILLVILIFVIPKMSKVFLQLRIALPLPTRILIFFSDILIKHTWYLLGGLVLFLVIFIFLIKKYRQAILEVFYRLPLVSRLIREIDLTRFTRSLYLLLSSGLPIITALELTKDVVLRSSTAKVITRSREMVMGGKKLSDGFRSIKGAIPSLMIKLVEAGEKSGQLEGSMKQISESLDYQVSNTLKAFTAIMEPVMLILISVSVGGMMISIIAPIYGIISQVGAR